VKEPGFTRSLREELTQVAPDFQARVHRAGALPDAELLSLTMQLAVDPAMYHPEPCDASAVSILGDVTPDDERTGMQAIKRGEVAMVLLAGRTPRLFSQLPGVGTSVLAWRLMQGGDMPVWIMVAPDQLASVEHHIKPLVLSPNLRGTVFTQFEGYRLTPDNRMAWLAPGVPDLGPLGNGDLGPALAEAGILDAHPAVKWVFISNVDNVMATPHEGLIGFHIRHGAPITCEVVDLWPDDRGGVLARIDGYRQIAEDWRLPAGFVKPGTFYSTNTMLVNVEVLQTPCAWRWHRIRRQVGSRLVVQHERLLQQYTEKFGTVYVRVPRDVRYVSAKTSAGLEEAGRAILQTRHP
jgi:UTP--glucose-1-phosphate uridylyltransferase